MIRFAAAFLLMPTLAPAQSLWSVPPGADPQPFLDAAAPGDTVGFEGQAYSLTSSLVVDRGIALIGLNGRVNLSGTVESILVQDIPLGQAVVIRDIEHVGTASEIAPGSTGFNRGVIRIDDCLGVVVIEDCHLVGELQAAGVSVIDSNSVVVSDCILHGASATVLPGGAIRFPSVGFSARNAHVELHGVQVTGGSGDTADSAIGPLKVSGSAGVVASFASLVASDSTLKGGQGWPGAFFDPTCIDAGVGGAALDVFLLGNAKLYAVDLIPGPGGMQDVCQTATTPAAPQVSGNPAAVQQFTGQPIGFDASPGVVPAGSSLSIEWRGTPGEPAFLMIGLKTQPPVALGVGLDLWLGLPTLLFLPGGTISPAGTLQAALGIPNLSVFGLSTLTFWMQGMTLTNATVQPPLFLLPSVPITIVP